MRCARAVACVSGIALPRLKSVATAAFPGDFPTAASSRPMPLSRSLTQIVSEVGYIMDKCAPYDEGLDGIVVTHGHKEFI